MEHEQEQEQEQKQEEEVEEEPETTYLKTKCGDNRHYDEFIKTFVNLQNHCIIVHIIIYLFRGALK